MLALTRVTTDPLPPSSCCRNACRSSVRLMLVGTQSVPWSFTTNTDSEGRVFTTFKVTNLDMNKDQLPDQMSLCMILTEPCASIQDFCYGGAGYCRYTFFNQAEDCCPTGDVAADEGASFNIDTGAAQSDYGI